MSVDISYKSALARAFEITRLKSLFSAYITYMSV